MPSFRVCKPISQITIQPEGVLDGDDEREDEDEEDGVEQVLGFLIN
jgi:hypothetical protein